MIILAYLPYKCITHALCFTYIYSGAYLCLPMSTCIYLCLPVK